MEPVALPSMQYRTAQMSAMAPGGCSTCAYFLGELVADSAHITCRQRAEQPRVIAIPQSGCAFWLREPGSD